MGIFSGWFDYDEINLALSAPASGIGVYYVVAPDVFGRGQIMYIGRAQGPNTSIQSRLYDHRREKTVPGATHFGYIECQSPDEACALEKQEIAKHQPQYNQVGTSPLTRSLTGLLKNF